MTRIGSALRVFGLALTMLLAQTLGLLHGVAHSPLSANAFAQSSAQASVHASSRSVGHGVFNQLFSNHPDESDCRLFDQCSHGDLAAGVPTPHLPLVLQPAVLSLLAGLATARWHALFQARGPPSLR